MNDQEKSTSKEIFQKLDHIMIGKSDYLVNFLNAYQNEVFGKKKAVHDSAINQAYKVIIGSILAALIKRCRSKWLAR